MTDARIKVISNPYERNVSFELWDDRWIPINSTNNPNSDLIKDDIVTGFFPFKAETIVRTLINEYSTRTESIHLEFEGPEDEYQELISVCATTEFKPAIILSKSNRHLLNARQVLPEIVRIYQVVLQSLNNTAFEHSNIKQSISRFTDASSTAIPICVIGNYSSGKSTFINGLIGQELLPNGDEPVTARVYQIKRSIKPDEGIIAFHYDKKKIFLHFTQDGLANPDIVKNVLPNTYSFINEDDDCANSLIKSMNHTLGLINKLDSKPNGMGISSRVDIIVPFNFYSSWSESSEFVIFDTPGSNAASRDDDATVLKSAMRGLTNGLPIYVTTYETLDTNDNKDLYDEISSIDAVDERFAMVVVNKADGASLPKKGFTADQRADLMCQQVPRTLYAQGIYFVSSIIALGCKNKGDFASDDYAEKYEDYINKFSNPSSRFYRVLYSYNILPAQIAERTLRESQDCKDIVFANSGMYCVEQEIERFAKRYSAYNKCQQARLLLKDIIRVTKELMNEARESSEIANRELRETLERDKMQLLDELGQTERLIRVQAEDKYEEQVNVKVFPDDSYLDASQLQRHEEELRKRNLEALRYDDQINTVKDAFNAIGGNLLSRVSDAFSEPNVETFAAIAQGLISDVDDVRIQREHLDQIRLDVDRATSNDLLEDTRKLFDSAIDAAIDKTEQLASNFWEFWADESKSRLYNIATGTQVLTAEKRNEITDIILHYPPLQLEHNADMIFARANFEKVLRFWFITLFKSEKLDLEKLAKAYNENLREEYSNVKQKVRENYGTGFSLWLIKLLNRITDKITDYNPLLHKHIMAIEDNETLIVDLTMRLKAIESCDEEVEDLMDWKE